MLEHIIIRPSSLKTFDKTQGTLFRQSSCKYNCSDGARLRSKEECFWHYFLSMTGIKHTYEPNLPEIKSRPDFGLGNNFLMEICGMVNFKGRNKDYKEKIIRKREQYIKNNYNIIEIYKDKMLINGNFAYLTGVTDIVLNFNCCVRKDPEILSFNISKPLETRLYFPTKDQLLYNSIKSIIAINLKSQSLSCIANSLVV